MSETPMTCDFCGKPQSADTPLIVGNNSAICDDCVNLAHQVIKSWGKKRQTSIINEPLPKPTGIKHTLDEYVIGQDLAKEILSVAIYNHFKRFRFECADTRLSIGHSDDVELQKSNVLLLGPSGTGKTLLASTLAGIVGVPFVTADATALTQAGYVGDDVDSLLVRLLDAADGNVARAEWGIIYIDEIDKLARASDMAPMSRDVSGEGVQQALLKLVEGGEVTVNSRASRAGGGRGQEEKVSIDTRNILFIVGGAFAGLEKRIGSRLGHGKKGIGFGAEQTPEPERLEAEQLLANTQPEDLQAFGLIPEFIGRFPIIAPLEPLDQDTLIQILLEPRNALVKQYRKLFAYENIELVFDDEAIAAIADKALSQGTGARGLRGVIESLLRKPMFELPSHQPPALRCEITEATVIDGEEPLLEFGEDNGEASNEIDASPAEEAALRVEGGV